MGLSTVTMRGYIGSYMEVAMWGYMGAILSYFKEVADQFRFLFSRLTGFNTPSSKSLESLRVEVQTPGA